jgi:tRNA(Ile)-lysidine synthase
MPPNATRSAKSSAAPRAEAMRGARPERELEASIRNGGVLQPGESVLVACSGGPDSVALAGALHAVAPQLRLSLRLAYVNHATRPSALQDECIVAALAAAFELPLDVVRLTEPPQGEAGLRDARYAALAERAAAGGCSSIAVGHHAEDQSETVLLALFRGSGPAGLEGMRSRRPVQNGVELVRPLLRTAPSALLAYCQASGLPYAIDPSNDDAGFRRNAVRTALAALRPLFPGLDAAVARAADLTGDEREAAPRAQLRRRIRERLRGLLSDVDFQHVEAAVRALERGSSGSFHMKAGLRLEIRHGTIAGITKT